MALLVAGVGSLVVFSCTPERRYRVLSVFFDGVPNPNAPAEPPRKISPQFIRDSAYVPDPSRPRMLVHEPYRKRECSRCHPRAQSLYLGEDFDRRGLCFECHEHATFAQDVSKAEYVHGPVTAGFCLVCHDAHESLQPGLLSDPDPRLCYNCHEREPLRVSPVHLQLGDEDPCLPCHDPHASENRFFLRKPGGPATQTSSGPSPGERRDATSEKK